MLGRTDHRPRALLILLVLAAFALAAVMRLGYWQVVRGAELKTTAIAMIEKPVTEPAVRGDIVDRKGVILATTAYRDSLAAYPVWVADDLRDDLANRLGNILGLNAAGRRDLLERLASDSEYAVLDRELTEEQSRQVRTLPADELSALDLAPHTIRVYPNPGGAPNTTLASHLLGFVTADGTGHYGIEQQYDPALAGKPRLLEAAKDSSGLPLRSSARVLDPGVDGTDVRLTIDATLQLQLEKELYATWVADRSRQVSGLVMDPATGQVLAWASVPAYDANDFATVAATHPELLQDPIVSQVYEPGSVMKMLTATAALKAHTVTPGKLVADTGTLRIGAQKIHDSDWRAMGWIPFRDVIAYSRNVGTARVAMRLGHTTAQSSATLYRAWQMFGIGKRTGVDVSGEVSGIAADPRRTPWQPIDLANRSFGQSVAVTPIQLATAYTPMINGGLRVQPHFLMALGAADQPAPSPTRVLQTGLASSLQGILHHVTSAVPWYAEGSLIRGWQIGGKTGTAQIWIPSQGRYAPKLFNFSYIGYVGGDQPAVVVALHIGDTSPKIRGHGDLVLPITSYQLFHRVAIDAIATLGIPRSSDPTAGLPEPHSRAELEMRPDLYAQHAPRAKGAPGSHSGDRGDGQGQSRERAAR